MNRPSLLVLMRHAESMRNFVKRGRTYFADDDSRNAIRGIPDHLIDITPEGERQAIETGPHLRNRFGVFDYVYHSGYRRTKDTMRGALTAYTEEERERMQIRRNLFIRERDPGHTYDMTEEEAEAAFPYLREYWKTQGGFFAQPPGGESIAQVVERVYLFINMLFRDRAGQKVLVNTHGGTIRAFRFLLEKWNYEQAIHWPEQATSPMNCGITVYEYDHAEKRLVLREYNTVYWTPQVQSADAYPILP